jgi:16S rRNA C967 or C1407 C5-methylase (RsmB/RsmF family)
MGFMPFDYSQGDDRVLFDRIICDVPCSSDAAIRKIPTKWQTWSTKESLTLHPLQIRILQRGLELLKVGGKISYSTCSLNPIENESVIAAMLKQYGDKIQLLDVKLEGFRFQPGLNKWKFMVVKPKIDLDRIEEEKGKGENSESFFLEFEKNSDVPEMVAKQGSALRVVRDTMFASHYDQSILDQLSKCLRVMPHHQNTSGFFITIIQKLKDFDALPPTEELDDQQISKVLPREIQTTSKTRAFQFLRVDPKDPDI